MKEKRVEYARTTGEKMEENHLCMKVHHFPESRMYQL